MHKIFTNQILEVHNLLSFRGKVKQSEFGDLSKDMEKKILAAGANKIGNPICATYGIEQEYIDVDALIPIDKKMESISKYTFRETIKIVNAIKLEYKGNPIGLKNACDELTQYMQKHNLQPITVGYKVTKFVDSKKIEETEIDVYVGINPNIL